MRRSSSTWKAEPRIVRDLRTIDPADWDRLHDGRDPFVSHAFLAGLEACGCVRPEWGWQPRHLTLWDGARLVAAAPGYLKHNSHGEFVFDHAWAHAFARHGRDYFPKWLGAVPYSPVTGPRLLAPDAAGRAALVEAIVGLCRAEGLSSAHVNFHEVGEARAFGDGWHERLDLQYHWRNVDGWGAFGDFLGALGNRARKNIRQERAKLAGAGVGFRVLHGDEATDDDLVAMHRFYLQTFSEYGNHPALTLEFLRHLARTQPRSLVIILADHGGVPVAGALCLRGADTLYGRYWGSAIDLPGLHFETCYYQGIEYCLREGLSRFEPGAQGEHKIARGFLPARVRSHHWIAEPAFDAAIGPWCREEAASVVELEKVLQSRSPYRHGQLARPGATG